MGREKNSGERGKLCKGYDEIEKELPWEREPLSTVLFLSFSLEKVFLGSQSFHRSLQLQRLPDFREQGWCSDESARLPPMRLGTPGPGVICGLSLLLLLVLAPRGFSPGTPVFSSPQKTNTSKFLFDLGGVPN